jgi:hypothetical protein
VAIFLAHCAATSPPPVGCHLLQRLRGSVRNPGSIRWRSTFTDFVAVNRATGRHFIGGGDAADLKSNYSSSLSISMVSNAAMPMAFWRRVILAYLTSEVRFAGFVGVMESASFAI